MTDDKVQYMMMMMMLLMMIGEVMMMMIEEVMQGGVRENWSKECQSFNQHRFKLLIFNTLTMMTGPPKNKKN